MSTILPMFPLELVAFPTERLALHIFEQRYQQLINDCVQDNLTFGIPTYLGNSLRFGTEVEVVKVVKRYPDGSSDILCNGLRIFELLDFESTLPNKLYAGGSIRFIENELKGSRVKNAELRHYFEAFYKALEVDLPVLRDDSFNSYTLAHKAGLTLEQEYDLLLISTEDQRVDFLVNHLKIMTKTLSAVNRTKKIIALNGHFKHFDPLDFTEMEM